jgi:hypothetical protein
MSAHGAATRLRLVAVNAMAYRSDMFELRNLSLDSKI